MTSPVTRWTPQRKARVVQSIRSGEITAEAAMAEHSLSGVELMAWMRRERAHGVAGLAVRKLQELRGC